MRHMLLGCVCDHHVDASRLDGRLLLVALVADLSNTGVHPIAA